jgi:hypothetical protein
MRILLLDIETAPGVGDIWNLWGQNIALNQLHKPSYMLCWAAKWLGEEQVYFDSVHQSKPKMMLQPLHRLLTEADAVVTYNGNRFDLPTINKEFLKYRYLPPAPYKSIDLYQTVKRKFRFMSNKMDHLLQELDIGMKFKHEGHPLWRKCVKDDPRAWVRMQKYNETDVTQMEKLYKRLIPWIDNHPNHATHEEGMCCPNCSSINYQRRGFALTTTQKYARYQCKDCGTWFRGNRTTYHAREKAASIPIL